MTRREIITRLRQLLNDQAHESDYTATCYQFINGIEALIDDLERDVLRSDLTDQHTDIRMINVSSI